MDPAIVIVIRNNEITNIRLVASTPKEERAAMDLFLKIQKPIENIRRILRSRNKEG